MNVHPIWTPDDAAALADAIARHPATIHTALNPPCPECGHSKCLHDHKCVAAKPGKGWGLCECSLTATDFQEDT